MIIKWYPSRGFFEDGFDRYIVNSEGKLSDPKLEYSKVTHKDVLNEKEVQYRADDLIIDNITISTDRYRTSCNGIITNTSDACKFNY